MAWWKEKAGTLLRATEGLTLFERPFGGCSVNAEVGEICVLLDHDPLGFWAEVVWRGERRYLLQPKYRVQACPPPFEVV